MDQKLKRIMLVDDNDSDNFLHERILKKANLANEIVVMNSGDKALEYLQTKSNDAFPSPDLIILDINMPRMNGWEFLEEYNQLDPACKGDAVTVMLSTSLNPEDHERAHKNDVIRSFLNKPLNVNEIETILEGVQK